MRSTACIPIAFLAVGCGQPAAPAPAPGPNAGRAAATPLGDDPAELYRAVLRDRLKGSPDGDGWYLRVLGGDPPAGLLGQLRETWPKLRPASDMPAGGRRIDLTRVQRDGHDAAEVWVESADLPVIDARAVYHLTRTGDAWAVASSTMALPCHPVSGRVLLDGRPLPGARLVFHPTRPGAEGEPKPVAVTDDGGRYAATTYETGDGAHAGEYVVTITCPDPSREDDGDPDRLRGRYADPGRSPLRVTIQPGRNEPLDFQLVSSR